MRELAQVPLLLSLLCLTFEERGEFPGERDDIYREATDALLVKWDSKRQQGGIKRDTVYRHLTLKNKQKLLAQMAGRAGRGLLGGRVIVQTYQPEHYAIQAAEHDFASFYIEEIRFRTQHSLPPFRRLARLLYIDPVNERGEREAEKLARALRLHIREKALGATEILGPTPPYFNRIDGRYRWQLLIRSPDPMRLLADFPVPRPWLVDIDPVSTL